MATPLVLTNFTAGELSELMHGRVDHAKYYNACALLENFLIWPQGPVTKRPGSYYVAGTQGGLSARLVPFIFSSSQAYVLEFTANKIQFYKNHGQIYDGANPYKITSPYTSYSNITELKFIQSADVLFIFHPLYAPRKLSRTSDTDWTMDEVEWTDGPYLEINDDKDSVIKPSGMTGTITIEASTKSATGTQGTWSGTGAADTAAFTAAEKIAAMKFSPTTEMFFRKFTFEMATASGVAMTVTGKIYSDSGGAPDTLIATSTNTVSVDSTGTKELLFSDEHLLTSEAYWIILEPDTTDPNGELSCVVDDLDYLSATDSSIANISDADDLGKDFKADIDYVAVSGTSLFNADHVGALWRIMYPGGDSLIDQNFSTGNTTSSEVYVKGDFQVDLTQHPTDGFQGRVAVQKSYDGIHWYDVGSLTRNETRDFYEPHDDVQYRLHAHSGEISAGSARCKLIQHEQWGYVKITGYTSPSEVTAEVQSRLADTDWTPEWREGAWSAHRGYPACGTFYKERLWMGGTSHKPQSVWGSWVGDYFNMTPGDDDDAAVGFTLGSTQMGSYQLNLIRWMLPLKGLILGTEGSEWSFGATVTDEQITPGNVDADTLTTSGSGDLKPVRVSNVILFCTKTGREIREMAYTFESDNFHAPDLTKLAEHITKTGVVDIDFQKEPIGNLFCPLNGGDMAVLSYDRPNDVTGWSRFKTEGSYESVAVIPASDGSYEVWTVVSRNTGRFVEYFKAPDHYVDDIEDSFFVDSGLTYDGAPATTISGLDHLEGEEVTILADGAPVPSQTVSSGQITLSSAASKVHVGLPYTAKFKSLRLEQSTSQTMIQTKPVKVRSVTVRLKDTLGCKIGPTFDDMITMPFREGDDKMDETTGLHSGDRTLSFDRGWQKGPQVCLMHDQPLPITVLALIPSITVGG